MYGAVGALTAGAVGLGAALEMSVGAAVGELHPPKFKWSHGGLFDAFDHASIRRGYQVRPTTSAVVVLASVYTCRVKRRRQLV